MVVTRDFGMLSEYEKIYHPQMEDFLICFDDESSSGEPADDGDQGTDVGGDFYTVCFGLKISHLCG